MAALTHFLLLVSKQNFLSTSRYGLYYSSGEKSSRFRAYLFVCSLNNWYEGEGQQNGEQNGKCMGFNSFASG